MIVANSSSVTTLAFGQYETFAKMSVVPLLLLLFFGWFATISAAVKYGINLSANKCLQIGGVVVVVVSW